MIAMLFAAAFAAQATPNPDQPPNQTMMVEPVAMMLAAFDTDGDGRVTKAESTAGIAHTFALADTAHAGSIGYIGYSEWAERWLGDRNALPSPFEVDGDHDDRITLAELQARIGETFDRLDVNHDGVLTRAELLTIRANTGNVYDGRRHRH
jgi:hypothetical protein